MSAQPPFSLNPKVLVILAVTGIAMAVPLAGVILVGSSALRATGKVDSKPAATSGANAVEGLRPALEKSADTRLGAASELGQKVPDARLEIGETDDLAQTAKRIENRTSQLGGSAFRSIENEREIALLIRLPPDAISRLVGQDGLTTETISAAIQGSGLLRLVIAKPSPKP